MYSFHIHICAEKKDTKPMKKKTSRKISSKFISSLLSWSYTITKQHNFILLYQYQSLHSHTTHIWSISYHISTALRTDFNIFVHNDKSLEMYGFNLQLIHEIPSIFDLKCYILCAHASLQADKIQN